MTWSLLICLYPHFSCLNQAGVNSVANSETVIKLSGFLRGTDVEWRVNKEVVTYHWKQPQTQQSKAIMKRNHFGKIETSVEIYWIVLFSSVQLLSRAQLFATPWITAHQAFLSVTNSQSIPKLKAIESVMPSSHQKEKLNRFQRNEPRTINDSSYYADMLIQIYLFMEVDIQSGSRQKREFKRKEFEMCLIVQLPACCFSNWPTRLV